MIDNQHTLPPLVNVAVRTYYDPLLDVTIVVTRTSHERFVAAASQGGVRFTTWQPPRRRYRSNSIGRTAASAVQEMRDQIIHSLSENIAATGRSCDPAHNDRHLSDPKHPGTTRCGVSSRYGYGGQRLGVAEDATCVVCISDLWRVISTAPFLRPEDR